VLPNLKFNGRQIDAKIADSPHFGEDRSWLDALLRWSWMTSLALRRSTAQGLALRARIILACAEGEQARWLQSAWVLIPTRSASAVGALAEHRLEGLWDEPRSGTPRTIEDAGSKR
jgi:hypothetical protein